MGSSLRFGICPEPEGRRQNKKKWRTIPFQTPWPSFSVKRNIFIDFVHLSHTIGIHVHCTRTHTSSTLFSPTIRSYSFFFFANTHTFGRFSIRILVALGYLRSRKRSSLHSPHPCWEKCVVERNFVCKNGRRPLFLVRLTRNFKNNKREKKGEKKNRLKNYKLPDPKRAPRAVPVM